MRIFQIVTAAIIIALSVVSSNKQSGTMKYEKPRVIVTSDGEIDDECSIVRFLLYTDEWDVEGLVTSSSQYHWHGHDWAGDHWIDPYLDAYAEVYPNLLKHNKNYPSPGYLRSKVFLGNVTSEGEMDSITPGSQHIAKVLLDTTDNRPIWLQAWGGINTIARALKTIEEEHPDRMQEVARKIRFFFIWEQDSTYQSYILPHWGKYDILTIICDQFWAIAYQWNKIMPEDKRSYFGSDWMKTNILENHGKLCSLYKAHVLGSQGLAGDTSFNAGDFRSEGDSPSFLHIINTGLRNMESPAYGGWAGRYVRVYNNTWLDPVPVSGYEYPDGRWYTFTAWGRKYMREEYPANPDKMNYYFEPITRWADAIQNDFAARADRCVKSFKDANHPPVVILNQYDLKTMPGSTVRISAKDSYDIDKDSLSYRWWQYEDADSYKASIVFIGANKQDISVVIPGDMQKGETFHVVCEVKDNGVPNLTRYQRVIVEVE